MSEHPPHIWAPRAALSRLVLLTIVVAATMSTGCPTYEDTYSGTFRETPETSGRNSDAVEVDFFRFGDNASAIVRFYKRDPITGDPFGEQKFCAWTDARTFDAGKNKFRLYINKSSSRLPRSQLFGSVVDNDTLDITLYEEQTRQPFDGIKNLRLTRYRDQPSTKCEVIDDFWVQAEFPRDPDTGDMQQMPASTGYQIHNPVFAVSWLGVQRAQGSNTVAPINRHVPAFRLDDGLDSNYDPQHHALINDRAVSIAPPPDIVRMDSGTTTMALGHFVVVDDSESDRPDNASPGDWQFSWDTSTEKVVASSLQRATRPSCDDGTTHWGPALFFVQDSLLDSGAQRARKTRLLRRPGPPQQHRPLPGRSALRRSFLRGRHLLGRPTRLQRPGPQRPGQPAQGAAVRDRRIPRRRLGAPAAAGSVLNQCRVRFCAVESEAARRLQRPRGLVPRDAKIAG